MHVKAMFDVFPATCFVGWHPFQLIQVEVLCLFIIPWWIRIVVMVPLCVNIRYNGDVMILPMMGFEHLLGLDESIPGRYNQLVDLEKFFKETTTTQQPSFSLYSQTGQFARIEHFCLWAEMRIITWILWKSIQARSFHHEKGGEEITNRWNV